MDKAGNGSGQPWQQRCARSASCSDGDRLWWSGCRGLPAVATLAVVVTGGGWVVVASDAVRRSKGAREKKKNEEEEGGEQRRK